MLILAGIISGIISGLGMGGGTILIIILTNLLNFEQHIAQANNLLFFIPTSIAAILVHIKNKNISIKTVLKMLPTCIIGAIIGSYVSVKVESQKLKKIFGIFLLCIGMYEIIITVKNRINEQKREENENEKSNDRNADRSSNWWHGRDRRKRWNIWYEKENYEKWEKVHEKMQPFLSVLCNWGDGREIA